MPALFVSHQRAEVARLAGRIARMAEGRVVECGDAATVLAAAGEPGSVPNVFRARREGGDRATVAGGGTILLPRPGAAGEEAWCRLPSGAVALDAVDAPVAGTSARNRLAGRVVAVDESTDRVRVAVDAGIPLHADVTPESARRLGLRPGTAVACVFKVHAIELLP